MKHDHSPVCEDVVTRRNFIKGTAGAIVTVSCLHGTNFKAAVDQAAVVQDQPGNKYICPPCGLPCDKLSFDKPGNCPQCGMTLIPANGEGGPPKVAILVYNGVEIIDIAGPWEVFGAAGLLVHTVAEKPEPLTLVYGQKVIPDYTFENSPKADVLLVPGGGYGRQMENVALIRWIRTKAEEAKYVMSVCTGAFLLGQAGLLSGQKATCTFGMVEDLTAFPNTTAVYDARFVESGKIITTAGLTSGIDGALHLVSRMQDKGKAQLTALGIEYHWDPQGKWTRNAMADRFLPVHGRLKGAESTLISTEGDDSRWETKLLVSDPKTAASIMTLVRERIANNTGVNGMTKRISHVRTGPAFISSKSDSELRWKFTDDQNNNWKGSSTVEPVPDDKEKFILTLKLARA
ncbi:MAG TPA: DJ-1/PfpI family protein [Pyrinomonadaceae bacterium]|nr:DJ-1/PfpI family protein [Pyrinomonadaceae bacterium]